MLYWRDFLGFWQALPDTDEGRAFHELWGVLDQRKIRLGIEHSGNHMLAYYSYYGTYSNAYVAIPPDVSMHDQVAMLSHEVGHVFLHPRGYEDRDPNLCEREAHHFGYWFCALHGLSYLSMCLRAFGKVPSVYPLDSGLAAIFDKLPIAGEAVRKLLTNVERFASI